jgi:hypothetical protein
MSHDAERSLYERFGGYDAIAAAARELVIRLQADAQLGRFWQHRGDDGIAREVQRKHSKFSGLSKVRKPTSAKSLNRTIPDSTRAGSFSR